MSSFSLILLISLFIAATTLIIASVCRIYFVVKGRGEAHEGLTAASLLMLFLTMLLSGMMSHLWWGTALGLLGLLAVAGLLILQDRAR